VTGGPEHGRSSRQVGSEGGDHVDTDTDAGGAEDDEIEGGNEREEFPAATLDRMQGLIDEHGYLSWLGVELRTASPGRAVMALPYREELVNPGGEFTSVHGGIPATLIDTASGFALRTTFDDPAGAALTTTDLDVSYLRPATADLRVESEVVRAGETTGVTRASVTSLAPDGDRTEVAIGSTTYRLFRDLESESAAAETRPDGER
jgi:uncharacterized protein (TIGR00369 family)